MCKQIAFMNGIIVGGFCSLIGINLAFMHAREQWKQEILKKEKHRG